MPWASRAALASSVTARLRSVSVSPLGPTAPFSRPPWPGSRTTSTGPALVTEETVAGRSHGVITLTAPPSRPTTGTITPAGVTPMAGSGADGASVGLGLAVVVVTGGGA